MVAGSLSERVPPRELTIPPRASTRRLIQGLFWLAATAAIAAYLWNVWRFSDFLLDDTFISLRYARHLVDGHGLVFNLGERVEGYTNFLFVILAAMSMVIGLDPVEATRAVSVAMAVVTLVLVSRMERFGPHPPDRRLILPASVLLLLSLQAFAYWSVISFETMLFTGLFMVALYRLVCERTVGRGHLSAWLFVLLSLTRPEGVYLFAVCNAVFWVLDTTRVPQSAHLGRYVGNAARFILGFGPYFIWRVWYYERWLPNTFDAKVTGGMSQLSNGLQYFTAWVTAFPLLAATLLLPLCLLSGRGRHRVRQYPAAVALYLITVCYIGYVVLVGGDFMPFFRFFLPVLPLCCLLLAWTVFEIAASPRMPANFARLAIAGAVLVSLLTSHATEQPYRAFVAHRTTQIGQRSGQWLRGYLQPDNLIAVNTAGSLPYYAQLPTIDMLGLTDVQIARRPIFIVSTGWAGHRKGWGQYVVDRQPRVILWYNSAGSLRPFYLGDHELADNPFFRFFYQPRAAQLANQTEAPGVEELIATFLGAPFGDSVSGEGLSQDLGLRAIIIDEPLRHTLLYESPAVLNYFEFSARDETLWTLKDQKGQTVEGFIGQVAEAWRGAHQPETAPEARAEVESLCEQARQQIELEDYTAAKAILAEAARRNTTARSPLVYQYIANLAVMTGDLFVALSAQKEALRLAPDNKLYQRNLANLLTIPYKQATRVRTKTNQ